MPEHIDFVYLFIYYINRTHSTVKKEKRNKGKKTYNEYTPEYNTQAYN